MSSRHLGGTADKPEEYVTDIIYGEQSTFEYYQPKSVTDSPVISIYYLSYCYRDISNPYETTNTRASACQVDINCSPEGNNYQTEKNAIVRIVATVNGTPYYSTGALMNNTKQDGKPYVLMSNRVLLNTGSFDAVSKPNLTGWQFHFNAERATCNGTGNPHVSITGATIRANSAANSTTSDFALVELNSDPRLLSGVTPYYLGWDRSTAATAGGVMIHHPSGDYKKIATYTMTPLSTTYQSEITNSSGVYWRVNYVATTNGHSVPEGTGSFGAPWLNSSKRVIGQLEARNTDCDNKGASSWAGKFSDSWTNNNAANNRRLSYWLDPLGTNPTTCNGGTVPIPPVISGSALICYNSSKSFSATNWVNGYTWVGSNVSIACTTCSTTNISANGSGAGYVRVMSGSTMLAEYKVYVGGPLYTDFIVELTPLQPGKVYHGYITWIINDTYPSGQSPIDRYEWSYSEPGWTTQELKPAGPYPMSRVKIVPPSYFNPATDMGPNAYVVGYNACGYGSIYVTEPIGMNRSPAFVKYYPNPTNNILNIEIDAEAIALIESMEQTITGDKQFKSEPTYDIYLYDGQGNLLRQQKTKGGTVQFNVSNLPNGIYYLHIYDGVNNAPEIQQIMVEH